MTDQHYGRAPCGCYREHPEPFAEGFVPSSSVCRQHGALFMDGVLVAPWHAASAIEQGLRAIAGWPMPLVEVCGGVMRLREQLVKEAKWEDVAPKHDGPWEYQMSCYPVMIAGPVDFFGVDAPSAERTRCYFCGRAVADGVCTVCGERQP